MFWCLEEWQERNKERRKEGLKKKTEWVRVWRRNLVGKKKEKKKKKKWNHNIFTINFKWYVIIS